MKYILTLLLTFILLSCNAELRIKDHSYTNEWHYEGEKRLQVYKTRSGRHYVLVLNKKETKFIRKYLDK
jgi:hypothetical protein